MLYNPGDYFCVSIKPGNWKAWLADTAIKEFTHSEYCHAGIVVSEKGDIVESTPHLGVHESHISAYTGMPMIFSNTLLTSSQRSGIVESAFSYVGRDGYGFLDIAYIALYLKGWNWRWLQHEVEEETHRTICSQFVAMCGRSNGVEAWMCQKSIPQLVFPSDLATLALQ